MESNQLPPHLHGLMYLLETLRMKLQGCRCQFVDFFCPGLTISTTIWWIFQGCVDTHDPDFRDPHFLPLVPPWGCYFFSDQFHGWDCIGWFSRCVKTEWMAVDMAQIFYGSAGSEGIQVWVQAVRDVVSDALENQFLFHSVRMEVSATSRPS